MDAQEKAWRATEGITYNRGQKGYAGAIKETLSWRVAEKRREIIGFDALGWTQAPRGGLKEIWIDAEKGKRTPWKVS